MTPSGTSPSLPASAASPVHAVLAELTAGTPTLDAVARRTGLDVELVEAVVGQLVRLGRVSSSEITLGCPASGCARCPATRCQARDDPRLSARGPRLRALSVLPDAVSPHRTDQE
jgi:hypothetical protein